MNNKELQSIAREAGAVSGRVVRYGKHVIAEFVDPLGRTSRCTLSVSASDWRTRKNTVRDIKRSFR